MLRRRRIARRPVLELLEERQLLTGPYTVSIQSLSPTNLREGGSRTVVLTLQVSPTPNPPAGFTAHVNVTTNGLDDFSWQGTSPINVGFQSGSTTATFPLNLTFADDTSSGDNTTYTMVFSMGGGSGPDGNQYIAASGTQTLTFHDDDITGPDSGPPKPEVVCNCPCSCTAHPDPIAPGADGGDPGDSAESPSGVLYGSGGINDASAPGVVSTGFGSIAGRSLKWTNLTGYDNGGDNGYGMVDSGLPSIQKTPNGASGLPGIVVVQGGNEGVWFDQSSANTYVHDLLSLDTLTHNTTTGDYTFTDTSGDSITFYGWDGTDASLPLSQQGKLKSYTDVNQHTTTATYSGISGQITDLTRDDGNAYEDFIYSYVSSGPDAGLVSNITLKRKIGTGSWTIIRQAAYTYYDGSQPYGNQGDLQMEQVEDPTGTVVFDTTYFRYYTPTDAGSIGYVHGLKYKFSPESYDRMVAGLPIGVTPQTATDSQVAPYADDYYEYDSSHRVTRATVAGAGAGSTSNSSGQGTYTYSYITNSTQSTDYNVWQTETIETLPDPYGTSTGSHNQNIVFTNFAGEVMLKAFADNYDPANATLQGNQWITWNRYDASGRLIEEAEPSAVSGYSTSNPDLINFNPSNGTSPNLRDTTGVIHIFDYGTANSATSSTAGDVIGYAKDEKIKIGDSVSVPAILLNSTQYFKNTSGTVSVYPVASQTDYPDANPLTGPRKTTYSYTFFSSSNEIQSVQTFLPSISSTENGRGTADDTIDVYDNYGRRIWMKDEANFIHYYEYDNATGALTKTINDVDMSQTSDFANPPQFPIPDTTLGATWSTAPGGGDRLITQFQVDGLGRTIKETEPDGSVTYTIYDDPDHAIFTYPGWNGTAPTGPTQVVREDRHGGYTETMTTSQVATSGGVPVAIPLNQIAIQNIQTLERDYTDLSGRVIEADLYTSLTSVPSYTTGTSTHLGTIGTNYNATSYGYDQAGQLEHVQDGNGTITDTLYDALGRATSVYVGTDDTTTNPPGAPWYPANKSVSSNMTLVSQNQYDGMAVGDSNLTQTTAFPDTNSADNRVTQYAYDTRDRLVAAKSGVLQSTEDLTTNRPIFFYEYDNLDELTTVSQYDGDNVPLTNVPPSASLLRARSTTSYDDLGRVYRTVQYGVDQSTGSVTSAGLQTDNFYGTRGFLLATYAPGGLVTKYQFDSPGRLHLVYQTDGAGGMSWSAAGGVSSDHVITQTQTDYDSNDNPILVTTSDRFHDATATGPLKGPTDPSPNARVSYVSYYYDAADRLTASTDVGTFGGNPLGYPRPSTPATSGANTHTTTYTYSDAGLVSQVTDPRGVITKTSYDMLGQVTQTINASDGGSPTASTNQTTNYKYDANGNVVNVQAVMPSPTPAQNTAYVYGVTTSAGSGVNSKDLLATVQYPDPTTGLASSSSTNQESYKYNAVGDPISFTDPNGSIHTYAYDLLGRQVSDAVTMLGSGVAGSIRRLTTAYDSGGRPYLFTSYDDPAAGNVVNQVENFYNNLGQLTDQYQEHGAAVNLSTTPEVKYVYTDLASGNNSRLTQMVYPSGRKLDYVYSSGTGLYDNAISRVSALADDNSGTPGTTLEGDSYLGLGTIIRRTHPEIGINLSYIQQTGDSHANTDAGDKYTGLDRFGRVIDQNWLITSNSLTSTDRFQYTYDRVDDVLVKNNIVNTAFGELYRPNAATAGDSNTAYDKLQRMTNFARGTLTSSGLNGTQLDTISSPSTTESWSLDALGNWSGQTVSGSTTTRSFNAQNQTTSTSPGTAPTYDHNGNTITDNGQTFIYDAWNRLVTVKTTSTGVTVASYLYDAQGWRIRETYANTNDLYYDSSWQLIEARSNGNLASQYVWSPAGIDTMVLRDSYSGGVQTGRYYVQQDANDNVTAIVDNSTDAVVERYTYDPYGNSTVRAADWSSRGSSSYGWIYRFQGGRLDTNITGGWYGKRNRDYIPSEGRWAERDPIGFGGADSNVYRFVGSNPASSQDPTGLFNPRYRYNPATGRWTGPQMTLVDGAFGTIATRLPVVVGMLNAELARLQRFEDPCVVSIVKPQLLQLRTVLTSLQADLANPNKNLWLYHYPFSYLGGLVTDNQTNAITYPAQFKMVFNDLPVGPWFTLGPAPNGFPALLFHELTHLYGTEDDDRKGLLMNAYSIAGLMTGTFAGKGWYQRLLRDARRFCDAVACAF